jgi:hypothetical protein
MLDIVTELRARLGFVQSGPASRANDVIMRSFLQEAHDYIYEALSPPGERNKAVVKLKAGQRLYDWNNDQLKEPIEPGRVIDVWLIYSDTIRNKMTQGITEYDLALTPSQWPQKWDHLFGQIEVWPTPDQDYDMVIEYITGKPRFTQDADRPGVPDRLVLLYAISAAKAHYRHPDAQASAGAFQKMLASELFKQKQNKRFFASAPETRQPQVVRTANGGYTLSV